MSVRTTVCCGFGVIMMIGMSAAAADARGIHQHSYRGPSYDGAYGAYYGDYGGAYDAYGPQGGTSIPYDADRAPYAADGETARDFQLQGR
jgi:hypothetical protein